MVELGVGILALPRFVEDDPWWGQDSLMTQVTFCWWSRWVVFTGRSPLSSPIFYVICFVLNSGSFTVSYFKTIVNGVVESRYPVQTHVCGVLYTCGLWGGWELGC